MIKQIILKDFCLNCRLCCRFNEPDSVWVPHLLDDEKKRLNEDKIKLIFSEKEKVYLCSFLEPETNKCKIYKNRPLECQLYPFLINLKDKKIFLSLDLNCPYIKEKLNSLELQEYISYLLNFLNTSKKIILDNPQLLNTYKDVLDISPLEFTYASK
jgi:Fe-S-cluster containining protein